MEECCSVCCFCVECLSACSDANAAAACVCAFCSGCVDGARHCSRGDCGKAAKTCGTGLVFLFLLVVVTWPLLLSICFQSSTNYGFHGRQYYNAHYGRLKMSSCSYSKNAPLSKPLADFYHLYNNQSSLNKQVQYIHESEWGYSLLWGLCPLVRDNIVMLQKRDVIEMCIPFSNKAFWSGLDSLHAHASNSNSASSSTAIADAASSVYQAGILNIIACVLSWSWIIFSFFILNIKTLHSDERGSTCLMFTLVLGQFAIILAMWVLVVKIMSSMSPGNEDKLAYAWPLIFPSCSSIEVTHGTSYNMLVWVAVSVPTCYVGPLFFFILWEIVVYCCCKRSLSAPSNEGGNQVAFTSINNPLRQGQDGSVSAIATPTYFVEEEGQQQQQQLLQQNTPPSIIAVVAHAQISTFAWPIAYANSKKATNSNSSKKDVVDAANPNSALPVAESIVYNPIGAQGGDREEDGGAVHAMLMQERQR